MSSSKKIYLINVVTVKNKNKKKAKIRAEKGRDTAG